MVSASRPNLGTPADDAVYDDVRLANGLAGEALTIPPANPKNFHQAIFDTDGSDSRSGAGRLP